MVSEQYDLMGEQMTDFAERLKEAIDKAFEKATESMLCSFDEFSWEHQTTATKKRDAEVEGRKICSDCARNSEFDKEEMIDVEAVCQLGYAGKVFEESPERVLEEDIYDFVKNVETRKGEMIGARDNRPGMAPLQWNTPTGIHPEIPPHINSHFNCYDKSGKGTNVGGYGEVGTNVWGSYKDGGSGGGPGQERVRTLDIPRFDSKDPNGWVLSVERIWYVYRVSEDELLEAVEMAFVGDVLQWYQWENKRRPFRCWSDLKMVLLRQYSSPTYQNFNENWRYKKQGIPEFVDVDPKGDRCHAKELSELLSEDEDDDLGDGCSELETPASADETQGRSAPCEINDELISDSELSDGGSDDEVVGLKKELELSDIDAKQSKKKFEQRTSDQLFNAVISAPGWSIKSVLHKWFEDENEVNKSDILAINLNLRRRKMYGRAMQMLEWSADRYEISERDYASRLDLTAKVQCLSKAEQCIEMIPKAYRGEVVYRTYLANCVVTQNVKKSEEVFNKMKDLGLPLTAFTCNQLLLLYKRTDKKKMADVLVLMENENVKPTVFTYNLLIDTKGRSRDINGMDQIVETMKEEGIEPINQTRNIMAKHYISAGFNDKAEAVAKEMEGGDLRDNRAACRQLLVLYSLLGKADEVARIWKLCRSDGHNQPVSFPVLPLLWSENETPANSDTQIFLCVTVVTGQKMYKKTIAWRPEISYALPMIYVPSKNKWWRQFQRPRRSCEDVMSTLITVHCFHFMKWNFKADGYALWNHMHKAFSTYEVGLSKSHLSQLEAIQTFFCDNYQYQQHHCFVGGKLGSSNQSSVPEVFQCANADCGHFYHPNCVAELLQPCDTLKTKTLQLKSHAGDSLSYKYYISWRDKYYDDILLGWHIASEVCYNDSQDHLTNMVQHDTGKMLSDYMIYLMIMKPDMMPANSGFGEIKFGDTCTKREHEREGRHTFHPSRYKHVGQFAPLGGEQTAAQLPRDWVSTGHSSQWLGYSVYASKVVSWRTRALVVKQNCWAAFLDERGFNNQFPTFHLEDKVRFWGGGIVMTSNVSEPLKTHSREKKKQVGKKVIAAEKVKDPVNGAEE